MTQLRLLICHQCKTVEEFPDFDGPPDRDEVLAFHAAKHRSAGVPHKGNLVKIDEEHWSREEVREQTLKQIQEALSGGETGLGSPAYNLLNTLREDAMTCFRQHQRNPACSDYKSPEKRLVPDTVAERKELGLDPVYDSTNRRLTRYLCEYCPVHSLVQQAARKRAGLYDN